MSEIEKLAAGLSEAARRDLMLGQCSMDLPTCLCLSSERHLLRQAGLIELPKRGAGYPLNELGLQVRAHLTREAKP